MEDKNIVSWTSMVSGYTQNGCFRDALMVFLEMCRGGVKLNQFGYGSTLRACTSLRYLETGFQIQGCIQKSRYVENLFVQSALIDFHSKCGKMEDACSVFERMTKRDLVSWNAIIGGYAVQGYSEDSFRVFCSLIREGEHPDCFTLGSVLKALAGGSFLVKVSQVHALTIQLGYGSCNSLSGSLINAYGKCGSIENSFKLYMSMSEKDIIACTALISGYAQESNHGRVALDVLKEMTRRQLHALIFKHQAYNDVAMGNALVDIHTGLTGEGWECFNDMVSKHGILPREEHIACLIDTFARGGWLEEAFHLICKMNVKPNASLWGSILGACNTYGNTRLGEVAAKHLFQVDPDNSANYVVLAGLYSATGAWDSAGNMRNFIEKRSLKKEPGHSLLQSTQSKFILLQPT
uniref:Pentatricopeptide repeat-containing protein n=1 Tax=Cannabis sativa TaxID=3483 RepID=A0A803NW67_CANSA